MQVEFLERVGSGELKCISVFENPASEGVGQRLVTLSSAQIIDIRGPIGPECVCGR